MRRPVFVSTVCLGLLGGIVLGHFWQLAWYWWVWAAVVAALASLRQRNALTLTCLVIAALGIGWWRGSAVTAQLRPYQSLSLKKVVIVGRASDDAVYGRRSQLAFGLDHLKVLEPTHALLPGSLKISGFGVQSIQRGDMTRVSGKLYPTRGNNQASISFAKLVVVARHQSLLDDLRRKFGAGLQSALPEPSASLGLGLLIGQRSTLPVDVAQTLTVVGLTHIIAVSGYNLTIMVDATRRMAGKRSKFQTATICVTLIFTFLLITGSSPAIVRASIISMLSILSWYYGRTIKPLVLLLVAAAVTGLANPLYVWGNVSWYLSFLAFFGVLIVAPLVTRRLLGKRKPKLVTKIVIESTCAQIMTMPYVLYTFGSLSFVAVLANVLVAAVVPLAMLLCFFAGIVGMVAPALAGWLAWPTGLVLTYMLDTANLLSRVPHGYGNQIGLSLASMCVGYALLGIMCLILASKAAPKMVE